MISSGPFYQKSDDWEQPNVVGHRRTRHGKCGKGKKRRFKNIFRRRFRPFKKTGKAHLADNDYDAEEWSIVDNTAQTAGWQESYYGKGKSYNKGSKSKGK